MKAGHWAQVKSHLTVGWTRSEDDDLNDAESWSIESFHVDEMHTIESPQIFFSEELDRAVPDALALAEARRNRAHEMIVEKLVVETRCSTHQALGRPIERATEPLPTFSEV
jgi:hypothetical protein